METKEELLERIENEKPIPGTIDRTPHSDSELKLIEGEFKK